MMYSTVAQVKSLRHIKISDTAYDSEIKENIEDADTWINGELEKYMTVPLVIVPPMIVLISKYKAAALGLEKEENEKETAIYKRFDEQAIKLLDYYIQNTFFRGKISGG